MKKFKQVAPAPAPKTPASEVDKPSITKHQMLANVLEVQKRVQNQSIEAFKKSVQEDGCGYAMIWKGEAAMFAEAFLYEIRGLEKFIQPTELSDVADIVRIREGVERQLAKVVEELCGSEYASHEGPWQAKSTSQVANIDIQQKANAKRRLFSMLSNMMACIDEQA